VRVLVAGSYHQAKQWCAENGVNVLKVQVLCRMGDEQRIRGMILTDEDVTYVYGWPSIPQDTLVAFEQTIRTCKR
jgi:hypothetical protein